MWVDWPFTGRYVGCREQADVWCKMQDSNKAWECHVTFDLCDTMLKSRGRQDGELVVVS